MANETPTTSPAAPVAPAPAAPATPSPAPRTPSTTAPGARQDALSAADRQRRLDSGPRRSTEPQPAPREASPAPDKPAAKQARAPSGYPYADPPAEPERIKLGEGFEFTPEELTDLRARAAAEASRKLTLPQTPDGYKAELPPDFKLPVGAPEMQMNERDPMMAAYRQFALEAGLDQTQFSKGLGLVTALRASEAIPLKDAFNAEMGKLGAAAPDRIAAVNQWIEAIAGEDSAAMRNIFTMAPVAGTIVAFEKMIRRFQSQGVTPFNQAHRHDAPDDGRIPGFDKMTFEQQRFAQDQRAEARRRQGR